MDDEKRLKQLFVLIPEIIFWAWLEYAGRPSIKNGIGIFGRGNGPASGIGTIISWNSPVFIWHIPFPYITVSWEFPWICIIGLLIIAMTVDFEKE